MVGYIYKITNLINQKSYIGKTANTVEERWKEHQKDCMRFPERPLYKALNKYGIKNFSIEAIKKIGEDLYECYETKYTMQGYLKKITEEKEEAEKQILELQMAIAEIAEGGV